MPPSDRSTSLARSPASGAGSSLTPLTGHSAPAFRGISSHAIVLRPCARQLKTAVGMARSLPLSLVGSQPCTVGSVWPLTIATLRPAARRGRMRKPLPSHSVVTHRVVSSTLTLAASRWKSAWYSCSDWSGGCMVSTTSQ